MSAINIDGFILSKETTVDELLALPWAVFSRKGINEHGVGYGVFAKPVEFSGAKAFVEVLYSAEPKQNGPGPNTISHIYLYPLYGTVEVDPECIFAFHKVKKAFQEHGLNLIFKPRGYSYYGSKEPVFGGYDVEYKVAAPPSTPGLSNQICQETYAVINQILSEFAEEGESKDISEGNWITAYKKYYFENLSLTNSIWTDRDEWLNHSFAIRKRSEGERK